MQSTHSEMFCGQVISRNLLSEIAVIVETFPKLTRTELANTICELFSWKRPTGKLKTVRVPPVSRAPGCQGHYPTAGVQHPIYQAIKRCYRHNLPDRLAVNALSQSLRVISSTVRQGADLHPKAAMV